MAYSAVPAIAKSFNFIQFVVLWISINISMYLSQYIINIGLKLIKFYKEERRKSRRVEPPAIGF